MNPFVLSDRKAGRQQSADNQERDRDGGDAEPVHCFLLATDDRWRSVPLGREATYDLGHAAVKISIPAGLFLPSRFLVRWPSTPLKSPYSAASFCADKLRQNRETGKRRPCRPNDRSVRSL